VGHTSNSSTLLKIFLPARALAPANSVKKVVTLLKLFPCAPIETCAVATKQKKNEKKMRAKDSSADEAHTACF